MFAWILTLPASAIMASLVYVAVRWVSGFVQRSTLSEESHKFIFPRRNRDCNRGSIGERLAGPDATI